MPKHKLAFEEIPFMQLWKDNPKARIIVTELLNNAILPNPQYEAWRNDFEVDSQTTAMNSTGTAMATALLKRQGLSGLADMRAPEGESAPRDTEGSENYSVPIAHFTTKHDHYTSSTMTQNRKVYESLSAELADSKAAEFLLDYAEKLRTNVEEENMTLTYMGEQLMTTGCIYYGQGAGIHAGIHKAPVPEDNFLGACVYKTDATGTKTLTTYADTDADLINSWRLLVTTLNRKFGFADNYRWQLDMPKGIWTNYVLKNKGIMEALSWQNNVYGQMAPATIMGEPTTEMVQTALSRLDGLPTIKIHDTAQYDYDNGIVYGWKQNIVTMRPLGPAGIICHTIPSDIEALAEANPLIKTVYTSGPNGFDYVENSIWPNGKKQEWKNRIIFSATPLLTEFMYHCILNTATTTGTIGDFSSMA